MVNAPDSSIEAAERALAAMRPMNRLVPLLGESPVPLSEASFTDVACAIKEILDGPEAVSIFFYAKETDQLVLRGNVGYNEFVRTVTYKLGESSLTGEVFLTREIRNHSAKELEHSRGPAIARCRRYLPRGDFFNVLAVPICMSGPRSGSDCLGVLKVENDGHNDGVQVRPEVVAKALILAHLLAIVCQMRSYADLWRHGLKETGETTSDYLKRLPEVLCKLFRVEGAFFYTRSGSTPEMLYQSGTFVMPDHVPEPASTLFGAQNTELALNLESEALSKRLERDKDPFLRELKLVLNPRNLLVAPLLQKDHNCGVVVLVNKDGGEFTREDYRAAMKFGGLIGDNIDFNKMPQASAIKGIDELQRVLGPSARYKGRTLILKAAEVEKLRAASAVRITGQDCANYLQVSRSYFLKLSRPSKSRADLRP